MLVGPTIADGLVVAVLGAVAVVSIVLAVIDLRTHTLPNRIVLPTLAGAVVLLGCAALLRGDPGALLRAAIGGAALFLFYLLLAGLSQGGMGMGDVKLAGLLGFVTAWVGWSALIAGGMAAFLLGGLFSVGLLLSGRGRRSTSIPFGPWMLAGAWLGIAVGDLIVAHGRQ